MRAAVLAGAAGPVQCTLDSTGAAAWPGAAWRGPPDLADGTTYCLSVLGGLIVSLGVIAALPLLNRIIRPETARNECPLLPEAIGQASPLISVGA